MHLKKLISLHIVINSSFHLNYYYSLQFRRQLGEQLYVGQLRHVNAFINFIYTKQERVDFKILFLEATI